MTSQKQGGVQWRHTSVLLRSDIFAAAQERGLNISNECNRTLADLVGIDFNQQQIPEEAIAEPVIIAPESKVIHQNSLFGSGKIGLPPVINADDPTTPIQVLKLKKEHPPRSIPKGSTPMGSSLRSYPDTNKPHMSEKPVIHQTTEKTKKNTKERKGTENAIKRFVTTKLLRTDIGDSGENMIAKDDMYQLFIRWCRTQSIKSIPDKKSFGVTLKNQFVMHDGSVDGTTCWINVKIR